MLKNAILDAKICENFAKISRNFDKIFSQNFDKIQVIGEEPEWLTYDRWGTYLPEGAFAAAVGAEDFLLKLETYGGPGAREQWERLMRRVTSPLCLGFARVGRSFRCICSFVEKRTKKRGVTPPQRRVGRSLLL